VAKGVDLDKDSAAELKRLRKLEKAHKQLLVEHDLLKKAIEWTSKQKQTSSDSSTTTKKDTK